MSNRLFSKLFGLEVVVEPELRGSETKSVEEYKPQCVLRHETGWREAIRQHE